MAPAPPPGVPVELTAEQARELAAAELAKAAYQAEQPGLLDRALRWVIERVDAVLGALASFGTGSAGGVLVVLLLIVALVVVVRWRLGRVGRTARVAGPALDTRGRSADDLRAEAREHTAAGRHDEAVRASMAALVRGLEERDLLVPRTGRTATEAAREAAAALPGAADTVADAARRFDETVYGGRPADAAAVEALRAADETVRATRPVGV